MGGVSEFESELDYNAAQTRKRNLVEKTFGQLKVSWRVLFELMHGPEWCVQIIRA